MNDLVFHNATQRYDAYWEVVKCQFADAYDIYCNGIEVVCNITEDQANKIVEEHNKLRMFVNKAMVIWWQLDNESFHQFASDDVAELDYASCHKSVEYRFSHWIVFGESEETCDIADHNKDVIEGIRHSAATSVIDAYNKEVDRLSRLCSIWRHLDEESWNRFWYGE